MIFVMGITMLKMDRAKATWRVKLTQAFSDNSKYAITRPSGTKLISFVLLVEINRGKSGRWILFILPLITVLREG